MADNFFERERIRLQALAQDLNNTHISLTDLARAFRLAPPTVRQLGIPAHNAGKSHEESLYLRADVISYLQDINDGGNVWSEGDLLLTPRETCVVLTSHGSKVTPSKLAKWRERGLGPDWIRISPGTIRYKQSALYSWLLRKKEKSQ